MGQRVLYYNPASLATHRHNPLDEIRLGVTEVKDTRNIVDMLIDPEAVKDKRDHWDHAVSPAITAMILHRSTQAGTATHVRGGSVFSGGRATI